MIYLIVSRSRITSGAAKGEAGTPLHIKVAGKEADMQPIIGFATIALAEKYLEKEKIPRDEYKFLLKDRKLSDDYNNQSIFLVEDQSQLDEMESDEDGYDYDSHIYKNA